MTPFTKGFGDELEKLALAGVAARAAKAAVKGGRAAAGLVARHPWKALGAFFIGGGAIEGARRARQSRRGKKSIRPSAAYYENWHKRLGIPRGRMTERQKQRLFAHARAVPGRYKQ